MNIETEMEWNSYMMKSGKVFGTYEFMIAKGHSWTDINYVVWDVEDNTAMPLIKAASSALNTHPDILLKDVAQQTQAQQPQNMKQAINQQQVGAFNERMQAQAGQGYTPQPTGAELWQAGKPAQAAVAGVKNLFTGGAHSRGGALDAQAGSADAMKERYRLRDMLNPMRNITAALHGARDSRAQARAGKTRQAAMNIINREFPNQDRENMTPEQKRRYERQLQLIEESDAKIDNRDMSRSHRDRIKDIANARWEQDSDPNKKPETPYPLRYNDREGGNYTATNNTNADTTEGDMDLDEEEAQRRIQEMGQEIPEAARTDSPVDDSSMNQLEEGMPTDAPAQPERVEGEPSWHDAIPHKGNARKGWINAITPLVADGKTPNKKELVAALKGKKKASGGEMSKNQIIEAVMGTFGNATPEVAAEIAEEVAAEEAPAEGMSALGDKTEQAMALFDKVQENKRKRIKAKGGEEEEEPDMDFGEEKKKTPKKKTPKKKKATKKKATTTKKKKAKEEAPAEEAPAEEEDERDDMDFGEGDDDKPIVLQSYDETHAWDSLLKRLNVR